MILRLSADLSKRLGVAPVESLQLAPNFLHDWSARLFKAERVQYILVINSTALYSAVFYARGIRNTDSLLREAGRALAWLLKEDGLEHLARWHVLPGFSEVAFSKALDRSLTGAISGLVGAAQRIIGHKNPSVENLSQSTNSRPVGALDYRRPVEVLRSLADA